MDLLSLEAVEKHEQRYIEATDQDQKVKAVLLCSPSNPLGLCLFICFSSPFFFSLSLSIFSLSLFFFIHIYMYTFLFGLTYICVPKLKTNATVVSPIRSPEEHLNGSSIKIQKYPTTQPSVKLTKLRSTCHQRYRMYPLSPIQRKICSESGDGKFGPVGSVGEERYNVIAHYLCVIDVQGRGKQRTAPMLMMWTALLKMIFELKPQPVE